MDQTTIDDSGNDLRTMALIQAIGDLLTTIKERSDKRHAVAVKNGDLLEGKEIRQKPERFLEEHFVRDCIEILDYPEYRPQPKGLPGLGEDIPDFLLPDDDYLIIGEIKKPNEFRDAQTECKTYLSKIEEPAAGIATDGFTWRLYLTDGNGTVSRRQTARIGKPVHQIGMECLYAQGTRRERRPLRERIYGFVDSFKRPALKQTTAEGLD